VETSRWRRSCLGSGHHRSATSSPRRTPASPQSSAGTSRTPFTQPVNIVFYAILGLLCGLVGGSTSRPSTSEGFFLSLHPEVRQTVIGLASQGDRNLLPRGIGARLRFLQFLVDGNLNLININFFTLPIIVILLLVAVFKIVATALTVGSGGQRGRSSLPPL
jgi:H+/Cl- antiporter ClcA